MSSHSALLDGQDERYAAVDLHAENATDGWLRAWNTGLDPNTGMESSNSTGSRSRPDVAWPCQAKPRKPPVRGLLGRLQLCSRCRTGCGVSGPTPRSGVLVKTGGKRCVGSYRYPSAHVGRYPGLSDKRAPPRPGFRRGGPPPTAGLPRSQRRTASPQAERPDRPASYTKGRRVPSHEAKLETHGWSCSRFRSL